MTAELGQFFLILAFCVSLVQLSLPLYGAHKGIVPLMVIGDRSAQAQLVLTAFSFGCLTYLYVVSDFSVLNVYQNSHTEKPLIYKISGVWGNHEGSMLLWILILTVFGAMVATFGRNLPLDFKARVLSVHASISALFLLFVLFTSNPFTRVVPVPLEGQGLNPILQDPGLAFHPPFLYFGYVGFSMAYSFAVAGLIGGTINSAWARWVRPWTLAAWVALTIGIGLGSWWAYYELGWGGWWFWDPVENASFMPWLLGTALLHTAIVVEKRDTLKVWTIFLSITTFGLSLLGTFLVRSGVLSSVHAFANDPERGLFILLILIILVGGAFALFAWRAKEFAPGPLFATISRESGLVLNNLLLCVACATVFIGTLYPLFIDAFGLSKVSVGPPYFNGTFIPLMIPLMAAVPIGSALSWKRADLAGVMQRLTIVLVLSIAACLILIATQGLDQALAAVGMGMATWLVLGSLFELVRRTNLFAVPVTRSLDLLRHTPRATLGMVTAHAGLGVLVAGITGVSLWQSEKVTNLPIGQSMELGAYTLTLDNVVPVEGPNYSATRGLISVSSNGRELAVLTPERRAYKPDGQTTTEAGIRSTTWSDVYVTIGEQSGADNKVWVIRAYEKPLVLWLWIGASLMAAGGLMSLSDRRLRIGAPRMRRRVQEAVTAHG